MQKSKEHPRKRNAIHRNVLVEISERETFAIKCNGGSKRYHTPHCLMKHKNQFWWYYFCFFFSHRKSINLGVRVMFLFFFSKYVSSVFLKPGKYLGHASITNLKFVVISLKSFYILSLWKMIYFLLLERLFS